MKVFDVCTDLLNWISHIHAKLIKGCIARMTPKEMKWLIRIILRGSLSLHPLSAHYTQVKTTEQSAPTEQISKLVFEKRRFSSNSTKMQSTFSTLVQTSSEYAGNSGILLLESLVT